MATPAAHITGQAPTASRSPQPFRFAVIASANPDGAAWTDLARRVESLGFDALLLPDNPLAAPAPIPALTWAAAATTTLRVGTYVAVNDLRHPLQLARDVATLQLLSDGRFELGLGVGRPGAERDYAELGIPIGAPGERVERLEAAIGLVRRLFAGEQVTARIGRYELVDAALGRPLAGAPMPRLLVAATGPRMLRLAGRMADIVALGVQPEATAEDVGTLASVVREGASGRETAPALNVNLSGAGDRLISYVQGRLADRLDDLQAQDAPGLLMGSPEAMVETVLRRRETLGISSYTVSPELIDTLAPVIARLRHNEGGMA